ncbi:MAG: hypothetical protein U0183_31895 [Polyangiaceae bacterium]
MRAAYGFGLLGAAIVVPYLACTSFGADSADGDDAAGPAVSSTSSVVPTATGLAPSATGTGSVPPGDASSTPPTTPPTRDPCLDRDAGPGIPQCSDAGAPSSVACGAQICRDLTRVCCVTGPASRDCQDGCTGAETIAMTCDDRDDCPRGMVCCADPPAGAGIVGASSCQAFCDSASLTLCTDASQCRSGICEGVGYKRCK